MSDAQTLECLRSLGLTTAELERLLARNKARLVRGGLSEKAVTVAWDIIVAITTELKTRKGTNE